MVLAGDTEMTHKRIAGEHPDRLAHRALKLCSSVETSHILSLGRSDTQPRLIENWTQSNEAKESSTKGQKGVGT